MVADSSRDVRGRRPVADRGRRTGRDSDPETGRHVQRSIREVRRGRGHELAFRAIALGVAAVVALVTAAVVVVTTPGSGGLGPLGGLLAFGVVGLAASSDGDDAIATLTNKVEQARADEQVEFQTDRDDGLGDLAAAVEGLAEDCQAAERERDLHERVIESAPVGVSVADATEEEFPLVSVNERFEELTGYEESEVVGRNCRFLQGEATEEESVAEMRRALAAGEETTVELRNYRKDGSEFWNQVRLAPIENTEGEVTHYVGFQEDVTERVERQAELERQLSLTESVFEELPVHIYVKDEEARHVRVSGAFFEEKIVERDESDMYGKTDVEIFDADFAEESYADDLQVIEEGEPVVNREEYIDHVDQWNLTTKVPWRGPDGEVQGLLGISREITERKERERELAQYRAYTDKVLDAIDDVFYVLDEDGTLDRWNETLSEVTGYDDEEIESMHATDFVVEEDRPAIQQAIDRIDELGDVPLEARFETRDGETIPYEFVAAPFEPLDGGGAVAGIARDISERKERDRRLEALVQNTKDPIFIKDSEGRYQFVNESIAALFGFERAEIVGKTDEKLFDEETAADIVGDDEQVLETGEYLSREVARPIDGDERIFLDDKYPYRDDDGEIIGLMGISRDITEQKETERALREREQRLEEYREYTEGILDAIDDVFYVLDEEGSLERWNQALVDVTGYDDDEIESMHATDFFPEADQQDIAEGIVRALETGDAQTEAPYQTKDGELIPFEFEASRMTDPDGETVVVGIGRDISERKAAQAALLEREQRLEKYREYTEDILDAIDDVFYVFDETGSIQRWNESLADVTGYTDEEIESMHGTDFFPEHVHETVMEAIPAVFESGEDRRVDAPVLKKDGEEIPYEFVATRVETPDDDPVLVGVGRDISEREAREREVRKTKNRIQRFIETSPVGVVATDPDGVVTLWNDAMETIFGWSEDEILGEPYPAIPEESRGEDEVRQRVLEGESVTQVECKRVRKDGEEIDISLSTARIHDDDGSVSEIVGYIEDITERKQRERELVARSAAIEQSIDGIAVLNDEAEYEYVNEAHVEVYGYDDPETFLGESWELCYGEEELERLSQEALPALNSVGDWRGEAVGKRADGSTYPQEVSLTKIDDGRIICVVRDITERKERERELQRTKDLLQQAGRIAAVGGWELDLTGESREMTWSDELYRIHGVSTDTEVDLETTVEFYHPQDQPKIRKHFERAVEAGESYDMEVRLQPTEDSMRWVRAIGEPVYEGDEVVRVRGSIQEITPQKERELALQSLHEATRGLLGVDNDTETARLVVDTAQSVLDVAGVAVFLLDESTNKLDAASCSAGFERLCESNPVGASDSDSLLWNTYVTGQPTVFDDTQAVANSQVFGPEVGGGLLVPLGDHGVFVVATQERAVDPKTRQLAETLVATTEAAFDRLASEATLRERDQELAEQNRALRRQIQITNLLRRIDQSLIQAGSREEVEAAVCDGLVESDDIAFAWIGALDVTGEHVEPSVWAGDGTEYLDSVSLATAGEAVEPSAATALSESPTVVSNVVEELKREPWRKTALGAEFQSVLSVPLAFEEYFYGVLTVYGNESEAFGDLEREVFAELGENIAHSINAVETQRALHTDQRVELTLDFDAEDDVLGHLAGEAGCDIEFAGLAAHTETETDLFIRATGAPTERVVGVLDDLLSVSEYRLVRDETAGDDGEEAPADASALFELTIDSDALPARFVRHGAGPNSIRANSERIVTVVDVPPATDVRSFVEMLQETHPSADLVSRQTVERGEESGATLVNSLFDALTDRQLEVLRTAYFAGFFEWPRTSTGEEVAEMLGVSQPTVNRHLRLGQQRLLEQLFEDRSAEAVIEAD